MSLIPRASAYGAQSCFRLFSHLLTLLTIAVILNPNGSSGKRTPFPGLQPDYPNLFDELDDGCGVSQSHFSTDNTLSTEPASTLQPITARAVTHKTATSDQYSPYMKGITSPLGEDDLEYSLDYYNEKALMKEYDFNSSNILKKLADCAITHRTPPNQFLEEIHNLISLQNRSLTEQNDSSNRDEASKLQPGFLSENLLKRMTEGWKNELKRLEKKYNVSSDCTDSESITAVRLALMFPHFLNFGQKPFAAPSNISFSLISSSVSSNCEYNYGRGSNYCQNQVTKYQVPSIFGRQEFGGLIPQPGELQSERERSVIIGVHLYALHQNDHDDMVPFRMKCVMLKRRMQKSALSSQRRFRFLLNNEIISKNGTILKSYVNDAYARIPNNFKTKIDWDLFDISRPF